MAQTRLNININDQTKKFLQDYAKNKNVSVTESLRRLVAMGGFIYRAQEEGKTVLFRDKNGNTDLVNFKF